MQVPALDQAPTSHSLQNLCHPMDLTLILLLTLYRACNFFDANIILDLLRIYELSKVLVMKIIVIGWVSFRQKPLIIGLLHPSSCWETEPIQHIVVHVEHNACPIALTCGTVTKYFAQYPNQCARIIFECITKVVLGSPVPRLQKNRDWTRPRLIKTANN